MSTTDAAPEFTLAPPEPVEPPASADSPPQDAPVVPADGPQDDADTFSRDYVAKLREEAAAARVKAKRTDDANARLVAAYAAKAGRLVDVDALTLTDALLGDDGLVDPDKVEAAVDALLAAKPYLARRTPTTPLPQGALPDAAPPVGLFDRLRGRV